MERLTYSLRTKCPKLANTQVKDTLRKLEHNWARLRLNNDFVSGRFLIPNTNKQKAILQIRFSDDVEQYFEIKGKNRGVTFQKSGERTTKYVVASIRDKDLGSYTRTNANSFRDYLFKKGLKGSSISRVLTIVKAIFNFANSDNGLNLKNHFCELQYDRTAWVGNREPIPIDDIRVLQNRCIEIDDDLRWLVALISDTGMRLADATGLLVEDIRLDSKVPFMEVQSHSWRPLKTKGSKRDIPLVGKALWSAKRIKELSESKFAFQRYNTLTFTSTNTVSASLNKWLRSELYQYTMYSFKHSFRNRLRYVGCHSEITNQIGGWSNKTVGQNYGNGYRLYT